MKAFHFAQLCLILTLVYGAKSTHSIDRTPKDRDAFLSLFSLPAGRTVFIRSPARRNIGESTSDSPQDGLSDAAEVP